MDRALRNIKKKFKEIKGRIGELLQNPEKRKNIIYFGAVLAVIIVILVIYIITSKNISSIERNALMKQSNDVISYLDYLDVDDVKTEDYILFALNYSNDTNSKSILTSTALSELVGSKFNTNLSADDIKNNGITEKLLDQKIVYNTGDDSYELSLAKKSAGIIAKTQVNYYKVKSVKKINKKKYNIVYQKYIIENPYDVLNYYISYNAENNDFYDITPLRNYLAGSDNIATFKKAIKDEDIDKFAKKDKKIKVTYVVKDDSLLIDKIGRCTLC